MAAQTPEQLYRHSAKRYADPAKVEPHAPVASMAPFTCSVCHHAYGFTEADTVHWVERICKCGRHIAPPAYQCDQCAAEQAAQRERERLARLASYTDEPETDPATAGMNWEEEREKKREANPLYAEAKAYVIAYKGDFDFLNDMKRRVMGQRGERGPLSERQVEAILKCKRADEERAQRAAQREQERKRNQTGRDLNVLPYGRTAAAVENESGELTFLLIDRPGPKDKWGQPSKWHGWVFVKQQQGPAEVKLGSQRPGETYSGQWPSLIDKVLADPIEAVRRYGLALGVCGVCMSPLTNATSRERGIGPVCEAKLAA